MTVETFEDRLRHIRAEIEDALIARAAELEGENGVGLSAETTNLRGALTDCENEIATLRTRLEHEESRAIVAERKLLQVRKDLDASRATVARLRNERNIWKDQAFAMERNKDEARKERDKARKALDRVNAKAEQTEKWIAEIKQARPRWTAVIGDWERPAYGLDVLVLVHVGFGGRSGPAYNVHIAEYDREGTWWSAQEGKELRHVCFWAHIPDGPEDAEQGT